MTPFTPSCIEEAFASRAALQQAARNISANITKGECDISNFVEQMGFALTSTVPEQRINGTKLLSDVLQQLPKDYLDNKQLEFLTSVYVDRFKDQYNVIPAVINGIDAIVEMKNLPVESVPQIVDAFFTHCNCQSQQRYEGGNRFEVLKFLTPRREDPSNMSRDKLAAKLADCLVAAQEFVEYVIPLALEKNWKAI